MTTTSLNCANCGAPLDVPATVRFATCRHCGSSLEIHRSESAEWSQISAKLADVAEDTQEIREDIAAIRAAQERELELSPEPDQGAPSGRAEPASTWADFAVLLLFMALGWGVWKSMIQSPFDSGMGFVMSSHAESVLLPLFLLVVAIALVRFGTTGRSQRGRPRKERSR